MRNAVNGIDPMRPGRINLISKVTAKYGDGLKYAQCRRPSRQRDSPGHMFT
jgi:hypothetical protein